jgi:hypothetical protein
MNDRQESKYDILIEKLSLLTDLELLYVIDKMEQLVGNKDTSCPSMVQ